MPRPTPAAVNAASNTANPSPRPAAGLTKKKVTLLKFDLPAWEHRVLGEVLKITLDVSLINFDASYVSI